MTNKRTQFDTSIKSIPGSQYNRPSTTQTTLQQPPSEVLPPPHQLQNETQRLRTKQPTPPSHKAMSSTSILMMMRNQPSPCNMSLTALYKKIFPDQPSRPKLDSSSPV